MAHAGVLLAHGNPVKIQATIVLCATDVMVWTDKGTARYVEGAVEMVQ